MEYRESLANIAAKIFNELKELKIMDLTEIEDRMELLVAVHNKEQKVKDRSDYFGRRLNEHKAEIVPEVSNKDNYIGRGRVNISRSKKYE